LPVDTFVECAGSARARSREARYSFPARKRSFRADSTPTGFFSASLGTFAAAGDAHAFYFHVSLPTTGSDAGDNALQGLSADESFTWSATQA